MCGARLLLLSQPNAPSLHLWTGPFLFLDRPVPTFNNPLAIAGHQPFLTSLFSFNGLARDLFDLVCEAHLYVSIDSIQFQSLDSFHPPCLPPVLVSVLLLFASPPNASIASQSSYFEATAHECRHRSQLCVLPSSSS